MVVLKLETNLMRVFQRQKVHDSKMIKDSKIRVLESVGGKIIFISANCV